ncbi:MAG: ABC transporter substrate-binding protein [Chloroflexi bacterium]|nr:ABC transporter substrate-binding protein [Chloroflexota bacterium]
MLAESWEIDPKDITFKLRKGVKFHDGTDFNARAVKFHIDRMLDPKTKSQRRGEIPDVIGAEVVDDYTVKVLLKGPSAPTFAGLAGRAGFIASPTAVEKWGNDQFALHAIGTGPFQLVEWLKDDRVVTKRFDGYWMKDAAGEKLPYLDGITYRSIVDDSVRLIELRTGNIQLLETVVPKDAASIKADKSLVYYKVPGNPYNYILNFNTKAAPFDKKELRQALSWAINREAFVKTLAFGEGEVPKGWWPEGQWMYDPTAKGFGYDVNKAKEMLARAGFPDGLRETMTVISRPEDRQLAEMIQAQWKEVGVELTLDTVERAAAVDRFRSGNFKTSVARFPTEADPDLYLAKYVSNSPDNILTAYNNPRFNELHEQARRTYDRAERKKLYTELNNILLEDLPALELYKRTWAHAMSVKLKGFATNSRGLWNCTACWLE